MKKSFNKILFFVLIIFLLPLISFFIYQFSLFNENEKQIKQIYTSQLETILFSINQYSEDIVSSWANELSEIDVLNRIDLNEFLNSNLSLKGIFFYNPRDGKLLSYNKDNSNVNTDEVNKLLTKDISKIDRLISYLNNNYRKIESLGILTGSNTNVLIFAINDRIGQPQIGGIILNPSEFIKNNLVSKIAQACGDNFILAALDEVNQQIVHSCKKVNYEQLKVKKAFWIFPDYTLAISMFGTSIEELVQKRYYENLIIMILLLVVLLVGVLFLYKNIKNEMRIMQLKSDFISNVSHELRTPLSLISMYSETLSLDRIKEEEKKKEYYNVIYNESNRLSKLVNSILNFSKTESGKRKYNFSEINLVKINNDVIETYKQKISNSGFIIEYENKAEKYEIYADGEAITEAMINLLDNAIKYSGESKKVKIELGENIEGLYWAITDYGIGIHQKEKNKIFEKFYRVSTGLIHDVKGTGLGLALVKQIMLAHKGDVIVDSKLGAGSTFILQFNKKFKSN